MRVRPACTAVLGCALWCAQAAAQSAAAGAADVQLSIPDCEGISGEEIAKLVRLELAAQHTPASDAVSDAGTRAAVSCSAERATITVVDPRRTSPLVLELALDATPPEARARFLALAVAELIATSRLEHVEARAAESPVRAPAPPVKPAS